MAAGQEHCNRQPPPAAMKTARSFPRAKIFFHVQQSPKKRRFVSSCQMVKLQIPQHMQGEDWARMPKPKERFFGCLARPSLNYLKPGSSRRSRFVSQAQTKEYASFS